ncbi:major facilitator superfamily domain-containing protein [Mycena floridula]|nr:major facilitator superfamily domain-containing protein [Mycena floridula]
MSEEKKGSASFHETTDFEGQHGTRLVGCLDEAGYKRILRKIDWHLLPFVSLLYLLSFLDRANIGNAKVAGMAKDLNLGGLKYNIIAAVFFASRVPYSFIEVPSNIALKLLRPSIWIPSIMVAWGLIMTLMSLVKSYEGLIIARIFLGLAEGGLFPGVTFYLSLWYRKRDVAFRIAIFFSAATVAGGVVLLCLLVSIYGIEKMEGVGGLHGWAWIFCLEGIATVLVAVLSFFFMCDYPQTATFLTDEERKIVIAALKEDSGGQSTRFDIKFVWQAMTDYKTYVQIALYVGVLIPVYAIALFLPTIVNELGFTAAQAQLLTVPPFAAGCLATILVGYYSDKYNLRGPFIIGPCLLAMAAYLILYCTSSSTAGYIGAFISAVGVFPTIAVDLAWIGSMAGGDVRKGVVIAMVIGLGNLGGLCSSFVYMTPPRFHIGHGTILGCLGLTIIMSFFNMWDFNRLNKEKEARCKREGIDESRWAEFSELGSESPLFR